MEDTTRRRHSYHLTIHANSILLSINRQQYKEKLNHA